jgi:hypothetical protein
MVGDGNDKRLGGLSLFQLSDLAKGEFSRKSYKNQISQVIIDTWEQFSDDMVTGS